MKHNICCIGHITLDHVITPRSDIFMPGGTAYYFGHAMAAINARDFLLATALAPDQMEAVQALRNLGVDVRVFNSRQTVCFENIYGQNSNHRTQRVLHKADPFTVDNIRNIDAKIFHLGTLLADDFAPEIIPELASRATVSADVQGFLRHVEGTDVHPCDWDQKLQLLPHISILKANEHEMESITGYSDPRLAARQLAQWGVREVVLTLGDAGSLIYESGTFHQIPAYPVENLIDATGCGDTYMAGYLQLRTAGESIPDAGRFAAAMCSLKLAASGPFRGTPSQIRTLLQHVNC